MQRPTPEDVYELYFDERYAAVNVAHMKLLKRTGARGSLLWVSTVGCLAFLGILFRHLAQSNHVALWTLASVLAGCVAAEWGYRRVTGRTIQVRQPASGAGGITQADEEGKARA